MDDAATFDQDGDGHLSIGGDFDLANAPGLEAALAACEGQQITVDCSAVTFMDSSGVHALLGPDRAGRSVRLVNVPAAVVKLLDLFHLKATFGLDGDGQSG